MRNGGTSETKVSRTQHLSFLDKECAVDYLLSLVSGAAVVDEELLNNESIYIQKMGT